MPDVALCRHAATHVNLAKRFLSSTDPPLCARGREQCIALREALRGLLFERCLVSPMRRCLETRELVAPELPFEVDDALREVDFGTWEGQTLESLELHVPELLVQRRLDPVHFRPPGGESIEDAALRLQPFVARLREGGATLVIGHRVTLSVLERLLRKLPLESQFVTPLETAEFRCVPA